MSAVTDEDSYFLFGALKPWTPPPWTTTDDRVRGGASQSYLSALPGNSARFYGMLDISTLGGAGFASQFSPQGNGWDLSNYEGVELACGASDGKLYTLILKDSEPSEKRDDGREKAAINWEADFVVGKPDSSQDSIRRIWIPWHEFRATFRGKDKADAGSLKTDSIQRVGLMMRSQFGKQEGEFSIELQSLCAKRPTSTTCRSEL